MRATLKRIPDLKIGKHGQLQEWSEDYEEPTPGISHVSHLFALFPSDEITLRGTPELANGRAHLAGAQRGESEAAEAAGPAPGTRTFGQGSMTATVRTSTFRICWPLPRRAC